MKSKLIVATIVGGIVAFLGGWLLWGILLEGYYQANTVQYAGLYRDETSMMSRMWALVLSNFTWAFLVSWIFLKWANVSSLSSGFIWGAFISFFITISIALGQWSMMNLMGYKAYIVDVLVNTVFGGIIGAAIGFVLGMGKKPA